MTKERQRLVEDNIQLEHFVANRYRNLPLEFEDVRSSSNLGLVKAAVRSDDRRGTAFATFAVAVMVNEIQMYARRQKKHSAVTASMDAPLVPGEDISLMDIITDEEEPYGEVELKEDISRKLGALDEVERKIFQAKLNMPGITQKELAEVAGISQSWVSRKLRDIRRKVMAG